MSNVDALDATISILRDLGRVERMDVARVQALRSMAESLDYDPSNAALWGRYLSTLSELVEADDDADSHLAATLAEIRGAAEVGNSSST